MDLSRYKANRQPGRTGWYWYLSTNPTGSNIKKVVQFQKMGLELDSVFDIYNLALADEIDGSLNFSNVTDNKDTKKALATITDIVEDYTSIFPKRWIYITGDTDVKTRLYQIHLSNNLTSIHNAGYVVLGFIEGGEPEVFSKGKNYDGFLVKRR